MAVSMACDLPAGGWADRFQAPGCDELWSGFCIAAGLSPVCRGDPGHLSVAAAADALWAKPGTTVATLDQDSCDALSGFASNRCSDVLPVAVRGSGIAMDRCDHDGDLYTGADLYLFHCRLRAGAQRTEDAVAAGYRGVSLRRLQHDIPTLRAGQAIHPLDAD